MTTTNRYDPTRPEHRATCQRSTCAGQPAHPGGRHLDQRDDLYDGPGSALQVAPLAVRDSARKIVREAPALMPEVIDLVNHIEFMRGQVAAVSVDKDRQVRAASERALDCDSHGEVIRGLERQVTAFDDSARASEAGRMVLLGFLHVVDELLRGSPSLRNITVPELISALKIASKKTHAAHDRAWKR